MKLLKFLASVTVCIALDSSVDSSRNDRRDSHSIRKGRALSDGPMQINDNAKANKSDMAEEARHFGDTFAFVGHYLGRPAVDENAGLYEKLLPKQTGEGGVAANEQKVIGLFKQVNEGYSNEGPRLMELVAKMQYVEHLKEFADTTMVTMLKNPKTMDLVIKEWIKSEKTPTEVSEFLLRYVKDEKWMNFVKSDLFNPWLTYVSRCYTKLKSSDRDTTALAKSVNKLFFEGRNTEETDVASAKAFETADGKHVAVLIMTLYPV